jgi:hypothetical protein
MDVPARGLLDGIEQFNRGKFFECHETLEVLWLAEPGPMRRLYQGILQVGVAFHHLRAGRHRAAVDLLERGCGYLQPFAPTCLGVKVDRLLDEAGMCLAELKRLGPEGLNGWNWSLVPRIEMEEAY